MHLRNPHANNRIVSTDRNHYYGSKHVVGAPHRDYYGSSTLNRPLQLQYSDRSGYTSKLSNHSLNSRSYVERSQIQNILKHGDSQLNSQLTLMGTLMKRNRTKSLMFGGFGHNLRFFVLDFQCQRFYYKENKASQRVKFICTFSQVQGIYQFITHDEKTSAVKIGKQGSAIEESPQANEESNAIREPDSET